MYLESLVDYKHMAKEKILIVEDNELNLKLFKDLLEVSGYVTEHTKDGTQVLGLCKDFEPDLVLMDIQLQGISGYDVIKEMKRDQSIGKIPVIAVTAFAMKDDKEHILSSGCEAYISKPIAIESFLETIKGYMSA
jgi:two-component system cell cycle response regulator DivK